MQYQNRKGKTILVYRNDENIKIQGCIAYKIDNEEIEVTNIGVDDINERKKGIVKKLVTIQPFFDKSKVGLY